MMVQQHFLPQAIKVLLLSHLLFFPSQVLGQHLLREAVKVRVSRILDSLLYDEDTDGDRKITIDDPHIQGTERGDKRFWMASIDGKRYEIAGTYPLSNLLQELKLAETSETDTACISAARIFEPPVEHISRSIRELYWRGLTRAIDEKGLKKILSDEKTKTIDGFHYLYVPWDDSVAYNYFVGIANADASLKLRVEKLPRVITQDYLRNLNGRHGLLSLELKRANDGKYSGVPFVVPGGRFNEMYGWDSYFIILGLLRDGEVELAKNIVNNLVYEINHYGKILNANRTYYLTRSQPPFLTSMMLAVYRHLPRNEETKIWLKTVLTAAIKEYRQIWVGKDRLTFTGLSRYYDTGSGAPPEVEPGHFDAVYMRFAEKLAMPPDEFKKEYNSGKLKDPELDEYFVHDRAMRESGHDTSYRLINRCADLVTVDLNSLLYKTEVDIARTIQEEFNGELQLSSDDVELSKDWFDRAERRKSLINKYLWNEERGMFFDYDFVNHKQVEYISATTFYPLWARLATQHQARLLIEKALPLLEMPGGIVASAEESRGPISKTRPATQWDYPYGWAPHQMLIWRGLINYGYDSAAQRLVYRWLFTIAFNAANYNGTITEKYNVVTRSHRVFAEYGNVGSTFSYLTKEGFGWTNASFEVGISLLHSSYVKYLNRLIPPEWIYGN